VIVESHVWLASGSGPGVKVQRAVGEVAIERARRS
jgi:hypothetical protein